MAGTTGTARRSASPPGEDPGARLLRPAPLRLAIEPTVVIGIGTAAAILASRGGPSLYVWTVALIFGLYAMSCNLLLGWAGRMSFGQAACFGAGAYATALTAGVPIPSPLLPVLGGVVGVLVILPVAVVALRSSGLMFAMLTFIWSGILYQFVFSTDAMGGENGLYGVPPYGVFGYVFTGYIAQTIYVAVATAIVLIGLRWLLASNFGTALQATRDDAIRAALLGVPVRRVYLIAIALSGFVGGAAGALLAQAQSTVDPGLFFWTVSGDGIIMSLIGGQYGFWGPMVGALILTALRQLVFAGSVQSSLLIGALLLVIVVFAPAGLLGVLDRLAERVPGYAGLRAWLGRLGRHGVAAAPGATLPRRPAPPADGGPALAVDDLHKSYLGVRAVSAVNEAFAANRCTAVIGPNGAGKTTLFSILSGEIVPTAGTVRLWGRDVTRSPASTRVHAGVSRTFQVARFFNRLPVLDNVLVAAAAVQSGGSAWLSRFGTRADLVATAQAALEAVGLGAAAGRIAASLSQAERKRLELAMVLAQAPQILLLDEPTAGLAKSDALAVVDLLGRLGRQGDLTLVLTSHDMDVVFGLADHVVLMAKGQVAMSGAPAEVRASEVSRTVYLGHGATAQRAAPPAVAAMQGKAPALSLDRVSASYGPADVLFDVSIDCAPGEVVGLLGRNGTGKTTTLLAVMGLGVRTRGRITCFGEDLGRMLPDERARAGIAWVPDARRVFGNMTVAENLLLAASIRSPRQRDRDWLPARRVERVADRFPLIGPLMRRNAANLSGGEQQMVAIARALAMDLPVLLIDEPTEGLAPAIVDSLRDALQSALQAFDVTVLLAEQNLEFCLALASRVCVLESGRVMYAGSAAAFAESADLKERLLGVGA